MKEKIFGYSYALQKNEKLLSELLQKNEYIPSSLGGSIDQSHIKCAREFFSQKIDNQRDMLIKDGHSIISAIVEVIIGTTDKDILKVVLPTLDGILFDRKDNVDHIYAHMDVKKEKHLITKLQKILSNEGGYDLSSYDCAARILAVVLTHDRQRHNSLHGDQKILLNSIINSINNQGKNETISPLVAVATLSQLFLAPGVCEIFLSMGGIDILVRYLSVYGSDLHISYYTLLCIWLTSFESNSAKYFCDPEKAIVKTIIECMQKIAREKIVRAALLIFRNLCDTTPEVIEVMVENKLIKVIDLELKKNIKDKDLKDDLVEVGAILEKNYRILSTFEKYLKEIKTNKLAWNPCHTEKFWRENIKKFEENDFALIKILVNLVNSPDDVTQAVACYDLGEFCRFHPFGKQIVEKLDGKKKIMGKIAAPQATVREQALLAVQKMMIHNWQAVTLSAKGEKNQKQHD